MRTWQAMNNAFPHFSRCDVAVSYSARHSRPPPITGPNLFFLSGYVKSECETCGETEEAGSLLARRGRRGAAVAGEGAAGLLEEALASSKGQGVGVVVNGKLLR